MIATIPILVAAASLLAADHARNDYSKAENWLCRPGLAGDVCGASKLDSTTVAADGRLEFEKWKANPRAPVDCFYVYPTISNDATANSGMANADERRAIEHQVARFGSHCRVYAPLYRQVTLTNASGVRRVRILPSA